MQYHNAETGRSLNYGNTEINVRFAQIVMDCRFHNIASQMAPRCDWVALNLVIELPYGHLTPWLRKDVLAGTRSRMVVSQD